MLKDNQKTLINNLFNILLDINEEALENDEFYNWLNENYIVEKDLEEVIVELKAIKEKYNF